MAHGSQVYNSPKNLRSLSNSDLWNKLKEASEDFDLNPCKETFRIADRYEDEVIRRFNEAWQERTAGRNKAEAKISSSH